MNFESEIYTFPIFRLKIAKCEKLVVKRRGELPLAVCYDVGGADLRAAPFCRPWARLGNRALPRRLFLSRLDGERELAPSHVAYFVAA